MDKGYIENGFIVDLSNAHKTSEIIYELSRILGLPEAREKKVCLKLGEVELNQSQLISVRALVESMDCELEFISTDCEATKAAAESLEIKVSQLENKVEAPEFKDESENNSESENPVNPELENALDKIFGEGDYEQRLQNLASAKAGTPFNETDERFLEADVEEEVRSEEKISTDEFVPEADDEETIAEIKKHLKEAEQLPTLYVQRTLRSGQSLKSDGNIVIIGDVNPGAEIIAKGDITVWGVLGGIAHAGSDGNNYSRIRALKLHAIQLRIGDVFARRPDTVNIPYVQKTDSFTPEEARVNRKHIVIYKVHEA